MLLVLTILLAILVKIRTEQMISVLVKKMVLMKLMSLLVETV